MLHFFRRHHIFVTVVFILVAVALVLTMQNVYDGEGSSRNGRAFSFNSQNISKRQVVQWSAIPMILSRHAHNNHLALSQYLTPLQQLVALTKSNGQPISGEEMIALKQALMIEQSKKMGIYVTPEQAIEQGKKDFFYSDKGKFKEQSYLNFLQQLQYNGYKQKDFIAFLQQYYLTKKTLAILFDDLAVPQQILARNNMFQSQQLDLFLWQYNLEELPTKINITEQEIADFWEKNKDKYPEFKTAEKIQFSYVKVFTSGSLVDENTEQEKEEKSEKVVAVGPIIEQYKKFYQHFQSELAEKGAINLSIFFQDYRQRYPQQSNLLQLVKVNLTEQTDLPHELTTLRVDPNFSNKYSFFSNYLYGNTPEQDKAIGFAVGNGYILFQVEKTQPATYRSLADVKIFVEDKLRQQKLFEAAVKQAKQDSAEANKKLANISANMQTKATQILENKKFRKPYPITGLDNYNYRSFQPLVLPINLFSKLSVLPLWKMSEVITYGDQVFTAIVRQRTIAKAAMKDQATIIERQARSIAIILKNSWIVQKIRQAKIKFNK